MWHEWNDRWEARIRDDKKVRFLGYYGREEQAARAHDLAAHRQQPGNFAILNFPKVKLPPPLSSLGSERGRPPPVAQGSWKSFNPTRTASILLPPPPVPSPLPPPPHTQRPGHTPRNHNTRTWQVTAKTW